MLIALQVVFCFSLCWMLYSYCVYPVLLSVLDRFFGKPVRVDYSIEPRVAVVVPVYNEQEVIRQKIENLFDLDYPPDKLTIWVGSDCSTDSTGDIVKNMNNPRVRLWVADTRGGKTEVINKLAPTISADILLFTDANTMHRRDSLRTMTRYYADPVVGGVAGNIEHRYRHKEVEEVLYRSFESRQKLLESRLHSTISAFGGFYSVRKEVFTPIQHNAYSNDDVLIPMNVIRKGYRMVFTVDAVSSEDMTENVKHEFSRRVRIGAGNFQAFFWLLDFLNPRRGWPWFCYVSHKVTRWFSPFFIIFACKGANRLHRTVLYGPGPDCDRPFISHRPVAVCPPLILLHLHECRSGHRIFPLPGRNTERGMVKDRAERTENAEVKPPVLFISCQLRHSASYILFCQ
jgi:cellulose synthase/poly-beta-1,6-N-acetylglucosamine synthase-like glycosyltransferase